MAWVALRIAGLWAIAVVQPLFDLLGDNPEFFVAHRAGAAEVLAVTLALALIAPSLLTGLVWLAGLAGERARTMTVGLVVGGLGCLLAMQLGVRAGATNSRLAIPIAIALGAMVACVHHRLAVVRTFLSVLSLATLVTPVLFFLKPGIGRLFVGGAGSASNLATHASRGSHVTTPVVLVVLDEVPLLSLLDADGQIDRRHYPNFAALAGDGVWYRDATTVHDYTRWAVPSIVTGRYPIPSALPSAVDHPDTLFTLLSRTHRMEVSEPVTDLCPQALCPREAERSIGARLLAITRDLRAIYLRIVLTDDLARSVPDLDGRWAGFGTSDDGVGETAVEVTSDAYQAHRDRWRRNMDAERVAPVRQFIERLGADGPRPALYFLHALISHYPFDRLPNGKQNATMAVLPVRLGKRWPAQPWAVAQQYQRHLLQMGFVDGLLGDLVGRLKQVGLYDEALFVVTADHGMSFTAGEPQRDLTSVNAVEIMRVPLIVKYPSRLEVTAHVSDANVETVDVLPTIADVLGIDVPWPIDGASLLDPARPARPVKAMFMEETGSRRDFALDCLDLGPGLRRKLDLFGDATRNIHRALRVPAFDDLIGRAVSEVRVAEGGGRAEILQAWHYGGVDPADSAAVFDVAGRFAVPRPDTFVAVAINGTIEAVTRTWEANPRGWLATPRFDVWRLGSNVIDVFVVDRDDAGVMLRRAFVKKPRPADLNLVSLAAATEWGVRQSGFYALEGPVEGEQFRWTRGRAGLSNLFSDTPPRALAIGPIRVPGGRPKVLKIEANKCLLFEGPVHHGWSSTLSLERCSRPGESLTLRFTTDAPRSEKDRRRLGIAVSKVALTF